MKLKTKLIPAIGLVATATTLPFTLTSCKKDDNEMVNLLDKFLPSGPQNDSTPITEEQANKLYYEALLQDKNIFWRDMMWSKQNFVYQATHPRMIDGANRNITLNSLSRAELNIKNIEVDKYPEEETTYVYPVLSFDMEYVVSYDVEYQADGEWDVGLMTTDIHISKLPFAVSTEFTKSGDPSYWAIAPAQEAIKKEQIDGWQVEYNVNMKETETTNYGGMIITTNVDINTNYLYNLTNISQPDFWDTEAGQVLRMLCLPETFLLNYSMDSQIAPFNMAVNRVIEKGVFSLAAFSWYMLPTPRPTNK